MFVLSRGKAPFCRHWMLQRHSNPYQNHSARNMWQAGEIRHSCRLRTCAFLWVPINGIDSPKSTLTVSSSSKLISFRNATDFNTNESLQKFHTKPSEYVTTP